MWHCFHVFVTPPTNSKLHSRRSSVFGLDVTICSASDVWNGQERGYYKQGRLPRYPSLVSRIRFLWTLSTLYPRCLCRIFHKSRLSSASRSKTAEWRTSDWSGELVRYIYTAYCNSTAGRFVDLYIHIKRSTGNADSALTNVRDILKMAKRRSNDDHGATGGGML